MITHVEALISSLEKKDKIISYLKQVYKVEIGEEIEIPEQYINNVTLKDIEKITTSVKFNKEYKSFNEKIDSYNLPDPSDKAAKSKIQKLKKMGDTEYLIKYVDLSGFKDKMINKDYFKKFVDGIKMLGSVEVLDLRNNNLNDSYSNDIADLFLIDSLKRINLRNNELTKITGKKIYTNLKNTSHLEFLDLCYNPLCLDEIVCGNICNSIKNHTNLYHLGISDSSRDASIRLLNSKKNMRSLVLEDNRFKRKALDYLFKILIDKRCLLAELNLKFGKLDYFNACTLEKALRVNRQLVYLNLYCCDLSDFSGEAIMNSLEYNNSLVDINLGFNHIAKLFCAAFKKKIGFNTILSVINISKNYEINNEYFNDIIEGLITNQSILNIGDLTELKIEVKQKDQVEKILELNEKFRTSNENLKESSLKDKSSLNTNIYNDYETNLNEISYQDFIKGGTIGDIKFSFDCTNSNNFTFPLYEN